MTLIEISQTLRGQVASLDFSHPVAHVYHPLQYAWDAHCQYLDKYGQLSPRDVLLFGMNPGPWGMTQTGIPFGEVRMVRDWLRIDAPILPPLHQHPKRPIYGWECPRSEVSGQRIWGWAKNTFGSPEAFFASCFIANYCPLTFLEESGRNRTPDQLKKSEQQLLFSICDQALIETIEYLRPASVVGVGHFTYQRATHILPRLSYIPRLVRAIHPSPANPQANHDWDVSMTRILLDLGVSLPP